MAHRSIAVSSWAEYREVVSTLHSHAFRGQSNCGWPIWSSLSRYLKTFGVHSGAWQEQEERSLRVFRRKAHMFLDHMPDEEDSFQWLALMQHHGAPTRLVDFTWSPFVAAFFALQSATDDAAVWALFPPKLYNKVIRTLRVGQEVTEDEVGPWVRGNYEKYFLPGDDPIVIIGEPHRMNQRLISQRGTFVMPGRLDKSIDELAPEDAVTKITLKTSGIRRDAMKDLYKMNITPATLFPDLDGLARSLAYELETHWAFDPYTNETKPGFERKASPNKAVNRSGG